MVVAVNSAWRVDEVRGAWTVRSWDEEASSWAVVYRGPLPPRGRGQHLLTLPVAGADVRHTYLARDAVGQLVVGQD